MKKLVLVLISAVLLTVFIAFNYLLWDRENKIKSFEYLTDSKNYSIEALNKQVEEVNKENKEFKATIAQLNEDVRRLQEKSSQLETLNLELAGKYDKSMDIAGSLLEKADLKPFEEIIKKWADLIDKGQYEAVYDMEYGHNYFIPDRVALSPFSDSYKKEIKSVKLKSLKPYLDKVPDDKKGSIFLKAVLEVKKPENSKGGFFVDGVNERYFAFAYDKQKDTWVIAGIFNSL